MICLQCIPAHNWSFLVYLCGTQWFTLSFLWARVPARALPALCVWGRRGARRRGGRGAPCTVGASIGIDPAPCQACYVPGATSDFSCAPSPFCVRHPPTAHDARRRGLHYRYPLRYPMYRGTRHLGMQKGAYRAARVLTGTTMGVPWRRQTPTPQKYYGSSDTVRPPPSLATHRITSQHSTHIGNLQQRLAGMRERPRIRIAENACSNTPTGRRHMERHRARVQVHRAAGWRRRVYASHAVSVTPRVKVRV